MEAEMEAFPNMATIEVFNEYFSLSMQTGDDDDDAKF
jgi:hypothetical protein